MLYTAILANFFQQVLEDVRTLSSLLVLMTGSMHKERMALYDVVTFVKFT